MVHTSPTNRSKEKKTSEAKIMTRKIRNIFELLDRLNDYYKMITGKGLKEKVKTEEKINAVLVRNNIKTQIR